MVPSMKHKHNTLLFLVVLLLPLFPTRGRLFAGEAQWQGIDEKVVERIAKDAGRPAREPFINTDQGDLLLLVFLLAGTIGGFIAGYYYRDLFGKPRAGKST